MHSLGIAHRDLKSSNCLIEKLRTHPFPTYNVVICDFGLSRVDSDVAAAIKGWKQSVVAGISVRYAAPEVFARLHVSQANKRSSRIADASLGGAGTAQPVVDVEAKPIAMASSSIHEDKSGDIYAYAIIMWELLERKIPWADLNNDEIEFAVRQGKRPHFNGNESLGVMENGDAADGDIADEEVEGEGRATDDRNDKHRRNHTRQSTVRTTASSILTSFKRFTFAKRPQENFDADAFMRENLTEIMVASWDQEPHVRPAFAEIKTKLALLLERLQRNAEVTE